MKFLCSEVDTQEGDAILVKLSGTEANVRVMDLANFHAFRRGARHRYYGGHYTRSPAIIRPPFPGHWYVTVDLGGHAGRVEASVSVVRT